MTECSFWTPRLVELADAVEVQSRWILRSLTREHYRRLGWDEGEAPKRKFVLGVVHDRVYVVWAGPVTVCVLVEVGDVGTAAIWRCTTASAGRHGFAVVFNVRAYHLNEAVSIGPLMFMAKS